MSPAEPRAQLGRHLEALGLAARQRGRRLAQPEIAEPDLLQDLEPAAERGHRANSSTASSTVSWSTWLMSRPR